MKTSAKVLQWTPRILCILAILFLGLFSLDAFAPGLTIWQQLGGFFMHNIPSFVLLAALIIAWKRELTGGIILIILSIAFSIFVFQINYGRNRFSLGVSLRNTAMIAFPFIVAGILFIWSHYIGKSHISES